MKSRLIIVTVYVHESTRNSYCSHDYSSNISFSDFGKFRKWYNKNIKPLGIKIRGYSSDKRMFMIDLISLEYNQYLNEIKKLVPQNPSLDILVSEFHMIKMRESDIRRLKQGFVCTDHGMMKPEDYIGSFTKEFIKHDIKYVMGNPFGYYGHFARTNWMDIYIMDHTYSLLSEEISEWLTSTSARHWMDNVDPLNKNDFETKWKDLNLTNTIKHDLKRWVNNLNL